MAIVRTIALMTGALLLAAAATLISAPAALADGGCSPQDLWNGIESTASAVTSGACASACADGGGCIAAAGVAAGLGGVAAGSNQATVNQFCNAVQTAVNDAQNAGGDISAIQNLLSQAGISAQDLTGPILGALSGLGDPLNIAECGCSLEQGVGQLGGDVLACFQDAICGLQQDLGWGGCGCHPPAPVAGNCTAPATCADSPADANTPECAGVIYGSPSNPPNTIIKTLSNGQMVINVVDGWDGQSYWCSPDTYCFCPSPLTLKQIPVNYLGDGTVMYTCQCPSGTTPAAKSGPGAEICICNNTGLVAQPPVKSVTNPDAIACPIPLTGIPCPNGQTRLDNKCVTPCSDPTMGMTADGACCNPNQVTSCGTCCPPGTTPAPNGTCVPPGVIQ
jgi:hypothetical protein